MLRPIINSFTIPKKVERISRDFENEFSQCLGAVDEKHVQVVFSKIVIFIFINNFQYKL